MRWWLFALALVAAWWPAVVSAQDREGPTPYEVAQAMMPCLAADRADGAPLMIGTRYYANIMGGSSGSAATTVVMSLDRRSPDREMREMRDIDFYYWLDDDPVDPPLVLNFRLSKSQYPVELRQRDIACFVAAYTDRLRAAGLR